MNGDREALPPEENRLDCGPAELGAMESRTDVTAKQPGAAEETGLSATAADAAFALNEPAPALDQTQLAPNEPPAGEPILLPSFTAPPAPAPARVPHFGHLLLLVPLALMGLVVSTALFFTGVHFHLFGVKTFEQASTEIHYLLGSEVVLYLVTFGLALAVFPAFWNEGFFAGVHWRGVVVLEKFWRLAGVAVGCFALAMVDGALLPGPSNAPIEKIFKTPGSAWLMFGFGISFAPFFEEMFFRGFLLPSLSTAWDWMAESWAHRPKPTLDANGHPQWSPSAMVFGAILTSLPFAGMHVAQQGHSLGPFLLLMVVSLILCAVRLWTRSLAASTVVHACYNLLIFSLTFLQTSGFRHLDKM